MTAARSLLHLSDTHFGTEQAPVVAALEAFVREHSPCIAVLSGDITQRATRAEFAAARALVDRLRIPNWVIIPGNHDIPLFNLAMRIAAPYSRYQHAFGPVEGPELSTDDWLVIPVKTTRRFRHEDGEVSAQQIEGVASRLRQSLRDRPLQMRVVVVHQPMVVPDLDDLKNILHGTPRATSCWAAAGADIVLSGHIHLPCILPLAKAHAAEGAKTWSVQAGTAVSSRVRRQTANSFNVLHPATTDDKAGNRARGCRVERWDFDSTSGRFALAQTRTLELGLPQPDSRT